MYIRSIDRLRRWHRRLAKEKGTGSLRRITVFVSYENVVRLLGFLGYQWSSHGCSLSHSRPVEGRWRRSSDLRAPLGSPR